MAEENDQEKTEDPSQYRIDEFRRKGEVAASKELNSVLVLSATILTLGLSLIFFMETIDEYIRWVYGLNLEKAFEEKMRQKLFEKTIGTMLKCVAPVFVVSFCVGILAQIMQIGFLYAPEVLELKFDRINPVNGVKRLFSMKSIAEVVKGVFKFLVIIAISSILMREEIMKFSGFLQSNVPQAIMYGKELFIKIGFLILLGLIVVAVADFAYEKYTYKKKLMQSKQQIKEEMKEKEGNPEIKQRIRSIQREMASKRMMADVPKADVIVTNPTHISIAIKYDAQTMIAPAVLAKGSDGAALRIREIAKEHDIPIVENVQLARTLYKTVKIGEGVPRTMYKAVAEVLAFVYKLKKRHKALK